jgi:ABC-type Fe3+-hydroxamate transport system substrate-binding protein
VVSLVPSLTELFFDLDLGHALVGRTSFCVEPADRVGAVKVVGGTKKINLMHLVELGPSHVLVNVDETPKELAEEITNLGVEVIVTHPNRPEDNIPLYRLFGAIFDRWEQAEAMVASLRAELDKIKQLSSELPSRKALYLVWKNPWITVSRDTYIANMLAYAGMQVVGHDDGRRYPEVKITQDLLAETDIILFSSEPYNFDEENIDDFRVEFSIGMRPYLCAIDGKMMSWYGSRAIGALRQLGEFAAALPR